MDWWENRHRTPFFHEIWRFSCNFLTGAKRREYIWEWMSCWDMGVAGIIIDYCGSFPPSLLPSGELT